MFLYMKICLINPPYPNNTLFNLRYDPYKQSVQSPGLAYIAGMLESHGYPVDVIECATQSLSLSDLYKILKDRKYDVVGISTFSYNFINVIRIANKLKSINPSTFLFLGGFHPTLNTKDVFESISGLDCCVIGEGEYTCLDLVNAVKNKTDFREIDGIAYKEDGEVIINPKRAFIKDLDSLPLPKITYISESGMAGIVSSRGCYGNCSFCAANTYSKLFKGGRVRRRSPQNVVNEIENLVKNHNVKSLVFFDDNFFLSTPKESSRVEEFYQLLKEKNFDISFALSTRANDIAYNKEMIKKLKEVGLDLIYIGIESFVQRQLDFYNKNMSVEQNTNAIKILNEIGISYDVGFIMLEPFTTIDEIITNLKHIRTVNCHKVRFAGNIPISIYIPLSPVYGSPIHKLLLNKNLLKNNTDLGYEFQDSNVRLYYDIVTKEWFKIIAPFIKQFDLIYKAKSLNKYEEYDRLLNEKIKLMELDIDFLESLCYAIKDSKIDRANCMEFIDEWKAKLYQIDINV